MVNLKKTSVIAALAAASLPLLAAAPASAAPVVLTVDYTDLDIATEAGAHALAQRVAAQAERACEKPFIRDLNAMVHYESCKAEMQENAAQSLAQSGISLEF